MIDHSLLMDSLQWGFVDLLVAGVGLAMSALGAKEQADGAKAQKKANKAALKVENEIAGLQQDIANVQYKTSKQVSNVTQKQEELRKQMLLAESTRQARQVARETQVARAAAVSTAEAQGGFFSTGLQGSLGSISQQGAEQGVSLFENTRLGLRNFALNRRIFDVTSAANATISGLNRNVAQQQTKLRSLGVSSQNAQAQQNFGASLFNTGLQVAGSAGTAEDVYKSLFTGSKKPGMV